MDVQKCLRHRPQEQEISPLEQVTLAGLSGAIGKYGQNVRSIWKASDKHRAQWDYRHFSGHAAGSGGGRPDFMLMLCTTTRVKSSLPASGAALYRKLMRESWRPAYFAPEVAGGP